MAETIVLDAAGIAVNRTQLDITNYVKVDGVDWGDAEIQAYTATLTVGEVRLHYRLPNRLIKIPLALKAVGGTSFAAIRANLQAKVGMFQREGGWIMRQVGATPLYADIQSATLHLGGSWLQAYRDIDVDAVLALECLPDWYGDEITLGNHTELTLPHLFFTEATINGAYPGRCRVVATNGTTVDQRGLLWGMRSRNYDSGTTAALFYEAEQLLPVNNAAGTALAGASGGTVITQGSLSASSWVAILSTNMVSGTTPLTHTGSYRVWARCYSASATPQYRFAWGAGGLSVPTINDPAILPGNSQFYALDLGAIRIDAPPVGLNQWFGAIQVNARTQGDPASVDCVWFQPLDDGAGRLAYNPQPPASSIATNATYGGTASDDSGTGSNPWSNPLFASGVADGTFATVGLTGSSHYLKIGTYGFAIPSSATIRGIKVAITKKVSGPGAATDNIVTLVKAGAAVGASRATNLTWPTASTTTTYGGATDLWGTTWTFSDVNNSGFGAAISAFTSAGATIAQVDAISITVYYALATGFTIAPDAVIAASGTAELRTDGMFRQGAGGTIYAAESNVIGDLPRVHQAGLEGRTLQVFLKQSRGNFSNEPDSAIDDMSALIKYRPSYLITP